MTKNIVLLIILPTILSIWLIVHAIISGDILRAFAGGMMIMIAIINVVLEILERKLKK